MAIIKFGFLKFPNEIKIRNYTITPVLEYNELLKRMSRFYNKDGYYYPGIHRTHSIDVKTNKVGRALKKTARISLMYRVPCYTHQIVSDEELNDSFRNNDGRFILLFLGFLFSTRLEFFWWEGRVNIKQKCIAEINGGEIPNIVNKAFEFWKDKKEYAILSAIYFFCRGKDLEFEIDKLLHYYTALESVWTYHEKIHNRVPHKTPHYKRILPLCKSLNVCYDEKEIGIIYKRRNGMIHEGNVDFQIPNGRVTNRFLSLELLVERLIIASLGLKPKFLKTPWWEYRGCQIW